MKKIINGKVYDTEKARLVGRCEFGDPLNDLDFYQEWLYLKRTGEYFTYGEGGPRTPYSTVVGENRWGGGWGIVPLEYNEAKQWVQEHMGAEAYESIFGRVAEGDCELHIRIPAEIADKIAERAAAKKRSVNSVIADALREAFI